MVELDGSGVGRLKQKKKLRLAASLFSKSHFPFFLCAVLNTRGHLVRAAVQTEATQWPLFFRHALARLDTVDSASSARELPT